MFVSGSMQPARDYGDKSADKTLIAMMKFTACWTHYSGVNHELLLSYNAALVLIPMDRCWW